MGGFALVVPLKPQTTALVEWLTPCKATKSQTFGGLAYSTNLEASTMLNTYLEMMRAKRQI